MRSFISGFMKKKDDKYMSMRTNMKLGTENVEPFVDLLETAVMKKLKTPQVSLEMLDNKQTNEVIEHFTGGFSNRSSLDKNDTNVLWSAAIKIIKMSDPIFSDRNCTTLQTASGFDVSTIASYLPLHHQQLLGALFSASEMIIRIDWSSANIAADSLSSVLIWNTAPGSLNNRHAFCNLINNQRKDFPYCHAFERKLNLNMEPLKNSEWIDIFAITASDLTAHEPTQRTAMSDRVEVLDDMIDSRTSALVPLGETRDGIRRATSLAIPSATMSDRTAPNAAVLDGNVITGTVSNGTIAAAAAEAVQALPARPTVPTAATSTDKVALTRLDAVTVETLQHVFSACYITSDDLEEMYLRHIDIQDDYADLA
jgi:hypothetical protein